MRVAALYDIHGNLPALEGVLTDVRAAGVDLVLVGGDVVPGPMVAETLDLLADLDLPVQCIYGNGERIVLAQRRGDDIAEVPLRHRDVISWTAQQLDTKRAQWLADWPATRRVEVPVLGTVLFCHATPRNDSELFTRMTVEETLLPVFAAADAAVVVCGHTHMQFDRQVGGTRVVNAGSVGMPFQQPPGAYWLLIGADIELRRTDYDFAGAVERLRATGFPMVEELCVRYVLSPPSEEESLRMFEPGELK